MQILSRHTRENQAIKLCPVASADDVLRMQEEVEAVTCSDPVLDYIVSLAEATRSFEEIEMGVSPRGSIALMEAAKGCAFLSGRKYVLPDDIQKMAIPVWAHRLVLKSRAGLRRKTPEEIIRAIIRTIPVLKAVR